MTGARRIAKTARMVNSAPVLASPFKATLSITQTCPLRCKVCYADCGRQSTPELGTEDWCAVLDEFIAHRFLHVFIEGGEPLLRPDLEHLLHRISGRMMVAVRTHATLLDAGRAEMLAQLGVGRIYVDLFAPDASTHDALTGVEGSFAASLTGIAHARAAGLPVSVLAILTRANVSTLQSYVDLAISLDCDQLGVLRLYPLGRALRHWDELSIGLGEQTAALTSLRVRKGLSVMQSWHPKNGNCCWQNACILPDGRSVGCPYLREYVDYGNVLDMPFHATWDHPLYRELRSGDVEQSCADCAETQGTRGGCRATAFAFHGRFSAPDPYCGELNTGVDLRALPERRLRQNG